ncbi:MAG: hypothetical protein PHH08_00160 [Candidatus ainarchaeum sp.]|nr:hypothetical protein [Candidatus ainarchaeum sp.]
MKPSKKIRVIPTSAAKSIEKARSFQKLRNNERDSAYLPAFAMGRSGTFNLIVPNAHRDTNSFEKEFRDQAQRSWQTANSAQVRHDRAMIKNVEKARRIIKRKNKG